MSKKLLFVYNPISGKQVIAPKLSDIIDIFTKAGYDVTCHPTQAELDCRNTVANAVGNYDMVVVSGGDGTLNEAVNGLMDSENTSPFGYIPSGSTNDFSHSVGIPIRPLKAAETIVSGKPFPFDLGCVNGRYFTYVTGFGALAEVSFSTPQNMKNAIGFPAYVLNGIATLPTMNAFNVKYVSDERCGEGEYLLGLVTNTVHAGGFKLPMSDHVLFDDGLFEIILVKKPKNIADINGIVECLLKRNFDNKYIEFFKTANITFTSDTPIAWTIDGENGGRCKETTITIHKKAVSVMVSTTPENQDNTKSDM